MLRTLATHLERLFVEYRALQACIAHDDCPRLDLSLMTIARWSKTFQRNPHAVAVEQAVEVWARSHGIWLEDYSDHTNTMGAYLHPETTDSRRLAAIDKTYLILFYIDDTISNELQKELAPAAKLRGKRMMEELFALICGWANPLPTAPSAFGVVNATRDLLDDLREQGDPDWIRCFMVALKEHLKDAVTDQNSSVRGKHLTISEFIDLRNDISGMFVTTWYMEFATGLYLRREALPASVRAQCERLEYLCAFIGGIANEFFSFEKEVIDHAEEFNLIPVMMEQREISFEDAIVASLSYMNDACHEFQRVCTMLQAILPKLSPEIRPAVESYIRQAYSVALASWFWELDTNRYQRPNSIFVQTDQGWRERRGYTKRLRSGQPLPEEYGATNPT
ncbi:MAG TPA: terpene synthase family protein [Aggregatilineales bacterium]|nr:hypothetical protein [Anaerolineales bacterium]HRE47824.1 terpene synthase family protein [Aggregatilineales bacterium]